MTGLRRRAGLWLPAVALVAMLLPATAQADTVANVAGEITYTQTSDAPLVLSVFGEPGDTVISFGGSISAITHRCFTGSDECPLIGAPTGTRIVLGDGDNVLSAKYHTRTEPLHVVSGGGKDLVELPVNASANTVDLGDGDDVVGAQNATADTIDCGDGYDTVLVDPAEVATDIPTGCERVLSEPGSLDAPYAAELDQTFYRAWPVTAHFTFAQSPSAAQVLCWTAGSGFAPCPNPAVMPDVADGDHVLVVAARLTVDGQRTDTLASQSWARIDRVPPPAPRLSAPTGAISTRFPTWSVTNNAELGAAGAFAAPCTLDGADVPCDSSYLTQPLSLGEGPHTLTAQARDEVGNASPVVRYAFVVDTQAPAAPGFRKVRITGRTVTVDAALEQGAGLECSVNGAAFARCSNPFVFRSRTNDTAFLTFRAVDAAGNRSGATSLAARLMLARLTATLSRVVRDGTVAAACHVRNAAIRSCSTKLKDGRLLLAAGSARGSSVRLTLTARARRQLARRGRFTAVLSATAVTTDGQRVTYRWPFTVRSAARS